MLCPPSNELSPPRSGTTNCLLTEENKQLPKNMFNDESWPLISIVTPCLNRAEFITEAIESVLNQDYPNIEHIIIDGGSTDGTLEILEKHPHLRVISEPDEGMYEALNKGIELARGDIIGFLNSDDLYAPKVFQEVVKVFQYENTLAVAGEAIIFSDNSKETIGNFSPENLDLLYESTLGAPYINAWFFKSIVFKKVGSFNANYQIVADREFMFRFALNDIKYGIINRLVYKYRQHPESLTFDVSGIKKENMCKEHIDMANDLLEKKAIPKNAQKLLRELRSRDTVEMAVDWGNIAIKAIKKSFLFMLTGISKDFFWVIKFIKHFFFLMEYSGENNAYC